MIKQYGSRLSLLGGLLLTLAAGLTGCTPHGESTASGLACFPEAAARWIAPSGGAADSAPAQSATVYVDRSGSMLGYIRGATTVERPLQDLIGTLPASLKTAGIAVRYRPFGLQVGSVLPDGQKALQTAAFYSCPPDRQKNCDNQESRLDTVFTAILAHPDEMAVVISDLWFTNSEIQTSGVTALQPLLADILTSGRTVAIYGIDAPFTGMIYDLPDAASISYKGRHPLFMIVVGRKADVLALDGQLQRSGSRYLAEGMTNGRIRKAVFTLDPMSEKSRTPAPIASSPDPNFAPTVFEAQTGVTIQQFTLRRTLPGRNPPPRASWSGPADERFIAGAVWRGPTTARTRIWYRRDRKCGEKSWLPQAPSSDGWSQDGESRHTLTIDPAALSARLKQPGVYLVSGELTRTSVTSPNPGDAWMRSAWNLAPERASAVAGAPPGLFPTLNLSEVARLMENALATAAERKGAAVDGFSILVKVES